MPEQPTGYGEPEQALAEALARVFSTEDDAQALLLAARFPRDLTPRFGAPLTFWSKVLEHACNGVFEDGARPVARAAARLFPHNKAIAGFLTEGSDPDGPSPPNSDRVPEDPVARRFAGAQSIREESQPPSPQPQPQPQWMWIAVVAVTLGVAAVGYDKCPSTPEQSVEPEAKRTPAVKEPTPHEVKPVTSQEPETCETLVALKDVAAMELKCLPAGTFEMGSPPQEDGHETDEGPQHMAKVAPFAIGTHEVTQEQWTEVMGTNPSNCEYGCSDDFPVNAVPWIDAIGFMNKLSVREGLKSCYRQQGEEWLWESSCDGYRLPTETEWEYAARAKTTAAYSFGSDASRIDEYAWYRGNSDDKVHTVGSKKANPWGLFDMHGNVWEWVWDRYSKYSVTETPEIYAGPEKGQGRVLRGGSFGFKPQFLRSANRNRDTPTFRYRDFGFRCARSLSAEPVDPSTL